MIRFIAINIVNLFRQIGVIKTDVGAYVALTFIERVLPGFFCLCVIVIVLVTVCS